MRVLLSVSVFSDFGNNCEGDCYSIMGGAITMLLMTLVQAPYILCLQYQLKQKGLAKNEKHFKMRENLNKIG